MAAGDHYHLGDTPTEYIRIELRTEAPNIPIRNIRIPPPAMAPGKSAVLKAFENSRVRILRVVCAAGETCPASANPDDPAIVTVISGPDRGRVRWSPAMEEGPLDEVRLSSRQRLWQRASELTETAPRGANLADC